MVAQINEVVLSIFLDINVTRSHEILCSDKGFFLLVAELI
jgi:hypothetical protein